MAMLPIHVSYSPNDLLSTLLVTRWCLGAGGRGGLSYEGIPNRAPRANYSP